MPHERTILGLSFLFDALPRRHRACNTCALAAANLPGVTTSRFTVCYCMQGRCTTSYRIRDWFVVGNRIRDRFTVPRRHPFQPLMYYRRYRRGNQSAMFYRSVCFRGVSSDVTAPCTQFYENLGAYCVRPLEAYLRSLKTTPVRTSLKFYLSRA